MQVQIDILIYVKLYNNLQLLKKFYPIVNYMFFEQNIQTFYILIYLYIYVLYEISIFESPLEKIKQNKIKNKINIVQIKLLSQRRMC